MISQRRHVVAIILGLLFTVVTALGIVALVALPNLRQGSPILTPDGERAVQRAKQQAKKKPAAAAGTTWHGLVAFRHRLARLHRRISRAWAPVSAVLHEGMDRLEARDAAKDSGFGTGTDARSVAGSIDSSSDRANGTKAGTPIRHAAGPSRSAALNGQHPVHDQVLAADQDGIARPSVGRPRPVPPISGPIPEVAPNEAARNKIASNEITSNEVGPNEVAQEELARNRDQSAATDLADERDRSGSDGRTTIDLRDQGPSTQRSDADRRAGSARRAR
jgi:hypothetical protein